MSLAPNGSIPSVAIAMTEKGVQIASNLTDVRLQLLLLTEAMDAVLRKLIELHPPEPTSRIIVPTNGGIGN